MQDLKNAIVSTAFGADSAWIWSMFQFFLLAFSLLLVYRQVRLQAQANVTQLLRSLNEKWRSWDMLAMRQQVCREYDSRDLEEASEGTVPTTPAEGIVLNFFEEIGLYVSIGALPVPAVWELFCDPAEHYWSIVRPKVENLRFETGDGSWYGKFQHLYEELMIYSKKRGSDTSAKTSEDLRAFTLQERSNLEGDRMLFQRILIEKQSVAEELMTSPE